MKRASNPYQQVIFVCTNARAAGERVSCAGQGRCGEVVLNRLKDYIKKNNLQAVARAAKSGCQEQCEIGPNAMLLPQNELLSDLSPADADEIIRRYLEPLVKR